jgi:regulation of enolase protein 1 (concanavalin A-like superfamily)
VAVVRNDYRCANRDGSLSSGCGHEKWFDWRMKWMNEPASWKRSGESLVVHSRAKTDFWQKTFYGYVTDNGHFFYLPVSGDFVFQARVNGQYAALYDQAGLLVRQNAENWMKCGTAFFDGQRHASVVFTRDFSGPVHHARFIQQRANLVASGPEKEIHRNIVFIGR